MVEPGGRRVEGALGGERADVQLVDDRAGQLAPRSSRRRTRRSRSGRHAADGPCGPVGQPRASAGRGGARRRRGRTQYGAPSPAARVGAPPAAVGAGHRDPLVARAAARRRSAACGAHTSNSRIAPPRVIGTPAGPPAGRSSTSATGRVPPVRTRPVSTSRHSPSGSVTVASPQPPPAEPVQARVTSTATWPAGQAERAGDAPAGADREAERVLGGRRQRVVRRPLAEDLRGPAAQPQRPRGGQQLLVVEVGRRRRPRPAGPAAPPRTA